MVGSSQPDSSSIGMLDAPVLSLMLGEIASLDLAVELGDAEAAELVHPPVRGGGVWVLLRLVLLILLPRCCAFVADGSDGPDVSPVEAAVGGEI
ncbi:hypothetical protein E2562_009049 [Oryza meyeriana var. granulata]|uniref:Uncharacterized protein n=1 Tax=Oryza meyeriana var. granulata TaxID=110450 RepID=A0A6G1D2R6_9ORYZ|nr:hypothetical protein E2562_009049 [Oryza meyeriana var. granulata]